MHDHTPTAPGGDGIRFSSRELLHLAGSVVVLSLAFSFALSTEAFIQGEVDWGAVLEVLPWSTLIVFTGFVLHELAHKVAAQRKHMWAEFRASRNGLVMALVVSAATAIVFAAPGAVHILGSASEEDNGHISVVGPLTNLAIGFAAVPLTYSSSSIPVGAAGNIWEVVVLVNVFLAGFNMLPVLPLDGAKVWRWSKPAYLAVVGLTVFLGYLYLV